MKRFMLPLRKGKRAEQPEEREGERDQGGQVKAKVEKERESGEGVPGQGERRESVLKTHYSETQSTAR